MSITLSRFVAVLGLGLILASPAKATLIFDFSFENVTGDTAGPITGRIFGLVDNLSDQNPTKIVLTGVGDHPDPEGGLPVELNIGQFDRFSVVDMVITSYSITVDPTMGGCFVSGQSGIEPGCVRALLRVSSASTLADIYTSTVCPASAVDRCVRNGTPRVQQRTEAPAGSVAFTLVPLPSTLSLFALGLAGIGFSRRKAK